MTRRQTTHPARLRRLAALVVLAASPAAAGGAGAQEPPAPGDPSEPRWELLIGAGAAYQPDYEGSDDYEITPLPVIMASYDDLVFLRGTTLGANLLTVRGADENDLLQIGPLIHYRFGRDEDDNKALAGLGDVDGAVELGAFVTYGQDDWSLGLTLLQDVSGAHDGLIAELEAEYGYSLAPQLRLRTGASVSMANGDYMDSFFGVGAGATSGLPAYRAEGGFKSAGLSLNLDYFFAEHWLLSSRVGYERLLGDAADSPLVEDAGSPDQVSVGLFLGYRF